MDFGYGKNAGDWVGKVERVNKDEQKAAKQRRKWIGKRNLEFSSSDPKAGGDPTAVDPGLPRAESVYFTLLFSFGLKDTSNNECPTRIHILQPYHMTTAV